MAHLTLNSVWTMWKQSLALRCTGGRLIKGSRANPGYWYGRFCPDRHWYYAVHEWGEAAAKLYIEKMAVDLQKEGLEAKGISTVGRAADTILSYIDQNGVDLVVMSTHGRSGINRFFMGSVADKVVRHSKAPVLLISATGYPGQSPFIVEYQASFFHLKLTLLCWLC